MHITLNGRFWIFKQKKDNRGSLMEEGRGQTVKTNGWKIDRRLLVLISNETFAPI